MVSLFKLIWFHRPWLQSIRKGKMCFLNLCAVRREACWVFGPPWWLKQVSTEAQTLFYYPENAELYLNLVCLAQWVLSSWEYLLRRLQVQFPLCPYNIYNYIIRIYLYQKKMNNVITILTCLSQFHPASPETLYPGTASPSLPPCYSLMACLSGFPRD